MNLNGKVVLITGASRGIGRACALHMASLGAAVAVNYSRSSAQAEEIVREIAENGGKALAVKADVSNAAEVDAMFEEVINTLGGLDILVNNAGITKDTLLIRMKEDDWDQVLDTNLKGAFLCTKQAAKYMMKKRQGRIVNISSVIGIVGNSGQANYAASKAGIIGLSKSAAKELASRGILVNIIAPGFIETDMTGVLPEQVKEAILAQIPLGRYGSPMDIAYLAAFLASDQSQYITGQVIHVDGGMIM
jgi:3-oxoacyl-[acyl-carrier protein] reductase